MASHTVVLPPPATFAKNASSAATNSKPTEEEYGVLDVIPQVNCFAIFIIVPFGIVANVLNIIVLCKGDIFSRSTTIAVLSLAGIDLIFLVTMPVRKLDCIISLFDEQLGNFVETIIRTYGISGANRTCAFVSISHIVVISCERLVAVFFPMSVNRIVTPRRMLFVLVIIYVAWFCSITPYMQMFTYKQVVDATTNQTEYVTLLTTFYKRTQYILRPFMRYFLSNIRGVVSMSIVVASSVAIGVKLFLVSRKRAAISNQKGGFDFKVAKTLLIICVIYIVVGIPTSVQPFTNNFGSGQGDVISTTFRAVVAMNDLLLVINSSVNFIVYFTTSTRFSSKLKETLCNRKTPRDKKRLHFNA